MTPGTGVKIWYAAPQHQFTTGSMGYEKFTVLTVLAWVVYLFVGCSQGAVFGGLVLIFGPILVILYMAFFRMILEMYYAIIRMSEDIHRWTAAQR